MILWKALEEKDGNGVRLAPVVAHVAQGGSLFKAVPDLLPVPLTRKQCHELLNSPSEMSFMLALRLQQAKAHGGELPLAKAWAASGPGSTLGSAVDEAFWDTVISFFAKNPMLDRERIGPLVDFINYRRAEEVGFSMKGRSPLALLKAMEEWHGTLYRAKVTGEGEYIPSGFSPYQAEINHRQRSGNYFREVWALSEILNGKDLAAEGRALSHCAYSYTRSIESKRTSIWSMTLDGAKVVTVEVRNSERRVVQARGRCNRAVTMDEFRHLNAWASKNSLVISAHL
jgi:hypothetical protein